MKILRTKVYLHKYHYIIIISSILLCLFLLAGSISLFILKITFLILGLAFMFTGLINILKTKNRVKNANKIRGFVKEILEVAGSDSYVYVPVIEYIDDKTHKRCTYEGNVGYDWKVLKPGEEVELIIFEEKNKSVVYINSWDDIWGS